ncbi:Collagen binding domain protein [compost metagenome]
MVKKRISLALVVLMLFVQYAYGIGSISQVKAAAIENEADIITSVSMAVYGPDGSTVTGSVYDVNSTVTLDYTWALPDGHSYSAGDTFTFKLPEQFQLYNDISGELVSDDGQAGVFTISKDTHEAAMTFGSYIESHGNVHGTLRVNTKFDRTKVGGSTTEQIVFPVNGGSQTIIVSFKPEVGSTIGKSGVASGFNAGRIDWTVDVNKRLEPVTNAVVTDPVPAGLSLDNTVTLAVYELNVQLDGSVQQGGLVDTGKYTAEVAGGVLTVRFADPVINGAYRLTYSTGITGDEASYTNTATFTGDGRDPASASATVTVERGGSLKKQAVHYDWGIQVITWAIEYNYNLKAIPQQSAVLTDLFDDSQRLVPGSVVVYPVTLDSTGTAIKGSALTENTDYTVSGITGDKKQGFKLQFTNGISSAYRIEYKTEAVGRVFKDHTVTNTVSESTYSSTATQLVRPIIIYKTFSGADYKAHTANWKITLNGDNYPMKEVLVTDTFPQGGQKLLPDTIVVRNSSGTVLGDSAYTLEYVSPVVPNAGFKVKFKSAISGSYTISYTTQFSNDWLKGTTDDFINTARIDWKDIEGVTQTASAEGKFIPRPEWKNNGFKTGVYDASGKELTWTVGVNYTAKAVVAPIVSDVLTAGQSLVPASLKVYRLNVDAKGDYSQGAELGSNAFSYSVGSGNELRVVFADSINEPYVIVFKTSLAGQLIGSTVVNTAKLLDGSIKVSKDLIASVKIPNGGEYVLKSGLQNGDKVDWSLAVNRSQSHVKDAKIIDTPSFNQILLPDSFRLYAGAAAVNGDITKSGAALIKDVDYTLQVLTDDDGRQSFELSFARDIDRAYILEYQSLIVAKTGDKLTNTAKFTGNNVVLVEKDTTSEIIVGVSSGSGTGSGERGTLTVSKLDAQDSGKLLAGATFELYRLNGTERVLVNTRTTDAAGKAVFNNLWLGSYVLIETAAPSGYVLDTKEYPVTIGSVTGVNLTVYNTAVLPTATAAPTATPTVAPTAAPTAAPTVAPTATPAVTESPVPTASPVPTESAAPGITPSPAPTAPATPGPTPAVTPAIPGGTPGTPAPGTEVPGIIVVDDEIPGGPAILPSATPGVTGTPGEGPVEIPTDEIPLGGGDPDSGTPGTPDTTTPDIDITDDSIPRGTVTDPAAGGQLPQTGENSPLLIYLAGLGLIAAGVVLNRVYRHRRNQ